MAGNPGVRRSGSLFDCAENLFADSIDLLGRHVVPAHEIRTAVDILATECLVRFEIDEIDARVDVSLAGHRAKGEAFTLHPPFRAWKVAASFTTI